MTADNDRPREAGRTALRWLLGATFFAAGAMHFRATKAYMEVMPSYLPYPRELVLISGACEMAGGVGVLLRPPMRRWAGWGLIALLVAVFPANVEIARRGAQIGNTFVSPFWGGVRLPFQALFIVWVWWCAVSGAPNGGRPAKAGRTPHKSAPPLK